MTALAEPTLGVQTPRIELVPDFDSSRGDEVLECAARAGLILDPWQQHVIHHSHGVRADGKWASFENGTCVPRQNGKGGIIEAIELAALYVFEDRLLIHSAHQFDTSLEAFRRLLALIEDTPDYEKRIKRVSRSHGEEGIELVNGCRIRFRTRTKGGGRGFTGDKVIFDEGMFLPEMTYGALLPTMSARPNPQAWILGSSVDQMIHEHGVVFARMRERAIKGEGASMAYFEWSPDIESPDELEPEVLADPDVWRTANPALGIRISEEHIGYELGALDSRTFAVERLGVGDWPATDGSAHLVISPQSWASLIDRESQMLDPVHLAFDVAPDRAWAAVVAAGARLDGLLHVEVIDRRPGTAWLPGRLAELAARHRPDRIVCDGVGPAASIVKELEPYGVVVTQMNTQEYVQACGFLVDTVERRGMRHLGSPELSSAIRGAVRRPLGDAWAWSRKNSTTDITPLVAATLGIRSAAGESGGGLVY